MVVPEILLTIVVMLSSELPVATWLLDCRELFEESPPVVDDVLGGEVVDEPVTVISGVELASDEAAESVDVVGMPSDENAEFEEVDVAELDSPPVVEVPKSVVVEPAIEVKGFVAELPVSDVLNTEETASERDWLVVVVMEKIAEEPHKTELDAIELKDAPSSDWSLK